MPEFQLYDVNGFYSARVPVSISSRAAVFASRRWLYRVGPNWDALRTACPNDSGVIVQTAQTPDEILALEWTDGQELSLLRFTHELTLLDRRPTSPLSPHDDPALCALTPQAAFCVTYENITPSEDPTEPPTAEFLHIDRFDLAAGTPTRLTVTPKDMRDLLNEKIDFQSFLLPWDAALWVHHDRILLRMEITSTPDCWDARTTRPIILDLDTRTAAKSILWHDVMHNMVPDDYAARPCFFDFDRGIMWTHPSKVPEHTAPYPIRSAPNLPLIPHESISPHSFIREDLTPWQAVTNFCDYFDAQTCLRRTLHPLSPSLDSISPTAACLKFPLPTPPDPYAFPLLWHASLIFTPRSDSLPLVTPLHTAAWEPLRCRRV